MKYLLSLLLLLGGSLLIAQPGINRDVSLLVSALLGETPIEEDLQELCDQYGGRVTGTDANVKSVEWGLKKFQAAGVKAEKQAFSMPMLWTENATSCKISGDVDFTPKVVSLSFSAKTPKGGLSEDIVDVGHGVKTDWEKVKEQVKGKIALIETDILYDLDGLFKEYADGVEVEKNAYEYGAAGVIYMSSRPKRLLFRHNASRSVNNTMPLIVMAREDAKRCLRNLRNGKSLKAKIDIDANIGGAYTSHNVIAEIKGSEKPEEVVVIGSHLDSWGLGTGANDNGCNVALMIDIARQIQKLGIKPKRTIRIALWNGEEQGFFGSWGYCQKYKEDLDKHVMALSVDIGSGPIIGFFTGGNPDIVAATDEVLQPVEGLGPFLSVDVPLVGTDNFDFMMEGIGNLIANHKPANYAPNYHAESDTYDKVDLKALKVNSAIVAALTLGFANLPDDKIIWKRKSRTEMEDWIKATGMEVQMRMFNVWEPWVKGERGRGK